MKLGMLSWSGINISWYKFCPIWGRFGICFSQTGASHNKHGGFGRERPTLGACLGPMQEMGMNYKDQGTFDYRQNVEIPAF